jgi:hypothetical protein
MKFLLYSTLKFIRMNLGFIDQNISNLLGDLGKYSNIFQSWSSSDVAGIARWRCNPDEKDPNFIAVKATKLSDSKMFKINYMDTYIHSTHDKIHYSRNLVLNASFMLCYIT